MKRRFLSAAAGMAAVSLVFSLQGCSASPQGMAERMTAAVAETPCTAAQVTGQVELSTAIAGLEVDTIVSVEESILYSPESRQAYMDLEMGYEMMGVRVPITLESYLVEEDGKTMQYLHSDDLWMYSEADSAMVQAGTALQFDDPESITLDKEVKELDGEPAVCLVGTVSGDSLAPLLGSMLGELTEVQESGTPGEPGRLDLEGVSADVRMYVDQKTWLPLRTECNVSGLDEVMNRLMDGTGITYTVNSFTMTCDYTSYQPQTIPALPPEAKVAADQSKRLAQGNPDNGNGYYTIREGDYYMDIATPDGYTVTDTNYDYVEFYNEELDRTVSYQMFATIYQNDLDLVENYYQELSDEHPNLYPDTGYYDTDTLSFCVMWVEYEENGLAGGNYFGWSYLEDQVTPQATTFPWIVVRVWDGGNSKDASAEWEDICDLLEYALPRDLAHLTDGTGTQQI